jgi:hypothetical protein
MTRWSKSVTAGIAFFIGLGLGYLSLVSGVHGGSAVPTLLLSAPTWALLSLTVGDTPAYAYGMIVGTGLQWAVYAVCAANNPRRGWIPIVVVHGLCISAWLFSSADLASNPSPAVVLLFMSVFYAAASAWLWLPTLLVAYWVGRRHLGIKAILLFTAAEAVAVLMFIKSSPYPFY